MKRHGNTVYTDEPYSIVELVQIYPDGSCSVLGYQVIGPGSDSFMYTLQGAHAKINKLPENDESLSPSP